MPLEFSVLIGLVAIVVCVLKGRYWSALGIFAALSVSVVGVVKIAEGVEEDLMSAIAIFGVPIVIAAVSVWLSLRPPEPDSYWARLRATDEAGRRLVDEEPGLRRFGRSVIGAVLGTLPAATFMAIVILAADTSDETQLSFAGIPFLFIGFIVGGAIGFHWVPRSVARSHKGPPAPLHS